MTFDLSTFLKPIATVEGDDGDPQRRGLLFAFFEFVLLAARSSLDTQTQKPGRL